MEEAEHIQDYLERVIEFKLKKELHSEYLKENQREDLLRELIFSLGFNEELWKYSKYQATVNFYIFEEMDSDMDFDDLNPKTALRLMKKHLLGAIHQDPFNIEFLKEYLYDQKHTWNSEYDLKVQYAQLYEPAGTELTSIQVDLGIKPQDLNYDYLDEKIIGPLINEFVFLQKKIQLDQGFLNENELDEIAKNAGVGSQTLNQIKKDVEEMIDVVEDACTSHWATWKDIHKAYLTVDRLVDLAPYNPQALKAAIQFYGKTFWRSQIGKTRLTRKTEGYDEFHMALYDTKKPSSEQKLKACNDAIATAEELNNRYQSLPAKLFEENDNDFFSKGYDAYMRSVTGDYSQAHLEALVEGQKSMYSVYKAWFEFDAKTFRFGLITAIILYAIGAGIAVFVFGSIYFLLTYIMVPILGVLGVLHLRQLWWKSKDLDISSE